MWYNNLKINFKIIFSGIVLLHLIDLLIFCIKFLFVYSDSDQTILWLASTDMSNGLFYEPAFYAQSYNTMVEALLAVPLIKMKVFVPWALSISTLVLSYSVIWLYSWYFYKRKNNILSMLCLALPILLPTEFQVMIGIPRGFVPGISFTLLGVYFLLTYQNRYKLIISGFCLALGFIFNPNASIIISSFMVYYFLKPNTNKLYELKYLLAGTLPAVTYKIFIEWFYTSNPNNNLHIFPGAFSYSLDNWVNTTSEIFYLLKGLFPVVNNLGCLSLILLLGMIVFVFKKSKNLYETLAVIAGFVFIIFSFGINKVSDGSGSPFFPYSRMFLGIPVLYLFNFSIIQKYSSFKMSPLTLLLIILLIFSFKTYSLNDRIDYIIKHNSGVVSVFKTKSLCQSCDSISKMLVKSNCKLLVLKTKRDEINYGCPALVSGLRTIHPNYERRLWVYEKEMFLAEKQFLIYSETPIIDSNVTKLAANYYLVKNNSTSLEKWFNQKNYPLRLYKK